MHKLALNRKTKTPAISAGARKPDARANAATRFHKSDAPDIRPHAVFAKLLLPSKLTIGRSDSAAERSADRVAEHVLHAAEPAPFSGDAPQSDAASGHAAPAIVHEALRSPGQPLDGDTRAFMESRFGADMSEIRIHTDAGAARSARAVNAWAFTAGSHIAFASERYQPHTPEGRRLLAHEIAHIAQQTDDGIVRRDGPPDELELDDDPFKRRKPSLAERLFPIDPQSPLLAPPKKMFFPDGDKGQSGLQAVDESVQRLFQPQSMLKNPLQPKSDIDLKLSQGKTGGLKIGNLGIGFKKGPEDFSDQLKVPPEQEAAPEGETHDGVHLDILGDYDDGLKAGASLTIPFGGAGRKRKRKRKRWKGEEAEDK